MSFSRTGEQVDGKQLNQLTVFRGAQQGSVPAGLVSSRRRLKDSWSRKTLARAFRSRAVEG